MRCSITLLLLLAVVTVGQASAQPTISLNSADLSALRVGDAISIGVNLSGLLAGDELTLLAADVGYSDQNFGLPAVVSGSIVPDVAGFEADEFSDLAGATFDALDTMGGAAVITANGEFFTFDVSASGLGSGEIALRFADALGEDSQNNAIDGAAAGSALAYVVTYAADFDSDLDVDEVDLNTWQANYGGSASRTSGDADDDLDADGRDFLRWQELLGSQVAAGNVRIVPEPNACSLLAALTVGVWSLRRTRFRTIP